MGRQLPKWVYLIFCNFFAKNCMKMKEFGSGGGVHSWHIFGSANDTCFPNIANNETVFLVTIYSLKIQQKLLFFAIIASNDWRHL